ncbi:uncharacterized protein LOC100372337 isoform X2 [Saccoglossus kowalevskii]
MSIETLLEAAEFLEWRAQARDDGERQLVPKLVELSSPLPRSLHHDIAQSTTVPVIELFIDDDAREKRRSGGRAHLKECFDVLKKHIPNMEDKKTSNLCILRSALRYIQILKKKEREYEHNMDYLARQKVALQQKLSRLKGENSNMSTPLGHEYMTATSWKMGLASEYDDDQASTSTASEGEDEAQSWSPPRSRNNFNLPYTAMSKSPNIGITRTITNGYTDKPTTVATTQSALPRSVFVPIPPKLTPHPKPPSPAVTHVKPSSYPSSFKMQHLPYTNVRIPKSPSPHVTAPSSQPVSIQVKPVVTLAATQPLVSQIMSQSLITSTRTFHQLLSGRPMLGQSPIAFNPLSVNPSVVNNTATFSQTPLITHQAILPIISSTSVAGKSAVQPIYSQPMVTHSMLTQPSGNTRFTPQTTSQSVSNNMIQQPVSQASIKHTSTVKAVSVTDSLKTIAVNN